MTSSHPDTLDVSVYPYSYSILPTSLQSLLVFRKLFSWIYPIPTVP